MIQTSYRKAAIQAAVVAAVAAAVMFLALATAPKSHAAVQAGSDEAVALKAAQLLHDPHTQVLGNPNGDVTIVEFFDYACPGCKGIQPRLEALLKADKGVKLVIKEFPILTPESLFASKVALASVKQGKYAEFHNALMAYKATPTADVVYGTAKTVGLNVARLKKDMNAPEISDEIYTNLNLARSLRIFATPGVIVGNHILTGSSEDYDFPKLVAAVRAAKS